MRYGILQEGKKGLYLVHDGKFMFIDRNCHRQDLLSEGYCEYTITKDMGKFGFINAKMKETDSIQDALRNGLIELSDVFDYKSFCGIDLFMLRSKDSSYYYCVDNKLVKVDSNHDIESTIMKCNHKFRSICLDKYLLEAVKSDNSEDVTKEDVIELIIRTLYEMPERIYVKNNKYVVVTYKYECFHSYVIQKGNLYELESDPFNVADSGFVDIRKDVEEFIMKRHLAIHISSSNDGIVKKEIVVSKDSKFTRLFLSTCDYSKEQYEKCKDILNKNYEEMEIFKKSIAKSVSAKTAIDILGKFNTRKYQLGCYV